MIYISLFLLSYIARGEHTDAGVMAKLPSDFIEFDHTDPIASDPSMQGLINDIVERNIRRGLSNPATLSQVDKQGILDRHNLIRSQTARGIYEGPGSSYQPQGCDMNALAWSAALEKAATDWSSRCYFEHNDGRGADMRAAAANNEPGWIVQTSDGCGENLYVSGADPAMNAFFGDKNYGIYGGVDNGWCADESKLYTYTPSPGASGTGHYTQVVWAKTRYVGCGFHQCTGATTDSGSYSWAKMIFTCNYFPAGNFYGQYPYTEGAPCTCCDEDRKECSHDGGLCGGGWNMNFNNGNFGGDKSVVDKCEDGVGRYVCQDDPVPSPTNRPTTKSPTTANPTGPIPTPKPTPRPTDPTPAPTTPNPTTKNPTKRPTTPSPTAIAQPPVKPDTHQPTGGPTPSPTDRTTKDPTPAPTRTRETAMPTERGQTLYVIRISVQTIWLTYSYDYEGVDSKIEELMFSQFITYADLEASVDKDGKQIDGPYCARPCYYIYGFVTVPMIIQGATEDVKDAIKAQIEDGTFDDNLCAALTAEYKTDNDKGLRCYRATATIEEITQSEYNAFIGDLDNDGVPFDTFNLESYSGADIFVLLIFLSFLCCACWCVGWYSHKKKFQKELEKELNLAANFNQQQHETDIRRQMAANTQPDMFEKGIGRFRNN